MKFRIIFIGKTGKLKEIEAAAKEVNPTAKKNWLGVAFPDDIIECEVADVDEGKALMRHIYQKVGLGSFPKRYDYLPVEKENKFNTWWSNDMKTYLATSVFADRYDYRVQPEHTEHFEDFLEAA